MALGTVREGGGGGGGGGRGWKRRGTNAKLKRIPNLETKVISKNMISL